MLTWVTTKFAPQCSHIVCGPTYPSGFLFLALTGGRLAEGTGYALFRVYFSSPLREYVEQK